MLHEEHQHQCEDEECRCDCQSGHHGCCCHAERCSCGCHGGFQRRYQTKEEQICELEAYLRELKTEVQAVEERLADLRK